MSLTGFGTVQRVDIQLQSNEVYNAGIVTMRAGITETLTVTADPIGVQTHDRGADVGSRHVHD